MEVVHTRDELLDARLRRSDEGGGDVAAVLTMGALHPGHLALVDAARVAVGSDGVVVATVFVNPLQFGRGEDLDRYPRTLEADAAAAQAAGVDLLFVPSAAEVYPGGDPVVTVDPGPLGQVWEGAARPGHFRGVLTVVAKLLNLVVPRVTAFGEKDYQQLVLVRRMCADLDLGVEVLGVPTVRDPDGLALSSRNAYLDGAQRSSALALSRALRAGQAAGALGADAVLAAARAVLDAEPAAAVDYLVLTDPDLGPTPAHGAARLLVAAQVGSTRLLDNVPVLLEDGSAGAGTGA
jgi:pantoate--beta-alanine ligase